MARTTRPYGFTLVEAIFSFFLIFLVLGALAYTLRQAGMVKSNLKNMGELAETVHAMNLIRSDLMAALEVTPASGSSDSLSLWRIDRRLLVADRIGPSDSPDDTNPFDNDERSRVDYFLQAGVLQRRETSAGNQTATVRLLACERFEVTRTNRPNEVVINLEVKNTRRNRDHTMKVALR